MRPTRNGPSTARVLAIVAVAAVLTSLTMGCSSSDNGGTTASTQPDDTGETTMTESTTPQPATDASELDRLAAEAYVWGYPLVVTQRTLQTFGGFIGVNTLFWGAELAGPQSRLIVAPNRDTLYSVAVLDLRSEPMVLTMPDVTDRYFTYQFLDAYTESFAYVGTRTTGGVGGTWVVTPPGWEGELPAGAQELASPSNQVFLLGRFLVDDEADVANVLALRDQIRLEPLSAATGVTAAPVSPPLGDAPGTPQAVDALGAEFFDELGDALASNPPTRPADVAALESFAVLGIGPDEHPFEQSASPEVEAALRAGVQAGSDAVEDAAASTGTMTDGWRTIVELGTYGDDFALRAGVAQVGWGANVPEEAVYPVSRQDTSGEPYSGAHTYRLHFAADERPPVDAFWSLSVYGPDNFFVEHPVGRYTIGDRAPGLRHGDDGSLDITLSHDEPADPETNWLPVPAGRFVLYLRLYLPTDEVVRGDYAPPGVERVD